MKKFISRMQNLSQKAAELKAAMQQVPPKVAEIRDAVTATAGQLQQLKHEIQFSVTDLKADHEDHLSEALQEIHNSAEVFDKAGFALNGVDMEISPVQRLLVHLLRTEDVHTSVLRSLVQANQHRRTIRAILSSLLQAKQMAETVEVGDLIYNEVIVGIGPIPSVRLCWRPEEVEPAPLIQTAPTIPVVQPIAGAVPQPPAQPASPFGASSFFERREAKPSVPSIAATTQSVAVAEDKPVIKVESASQPTVSTDPLARFKKMPILNR